MAGGRNESEVSSDGSAVPPNQQALQKMASAADMVAAGTRLTTPACNKIHGNGSGDCDKIHTVTVNDADSDGCASAQPPRQPRRMHEHSSCYLWVADGLTAFFGSAYMSICAVLLTIGWAISGPFMGFNATWQIVMNSLCAISLYLMGFILQASENRFNELRHAEFDRLLALEQLARSRGLQVRRLNKAHAAHAPMTLFDRFANRVASSMGSPAALFIAIALMLGWFIAGPFVGWSDLWQLIANTAMSVFEFNMVFIIQNTKNRHSRALRHRIAVLVEENESFLLAAGVPAEDIAATAAAGCPIPIKRGWFGKFADFVKYACGSLWLFALAWATVIIWLGFGPRSQWSDTWQLVINTEATTVTYLVFFILQNTANHATHDLERHLMCLFSGTTDGTVKDLPSVPKYGCFRAGMARAALVITEWVGSSWATALAFASVIVWFIFGPPYHWNMTWLLIINTFTMNAQTIIMILLEGAQHHRDAQAEAIFEAVEAVRSSCTADDEV